MFVVRGTPATVHTRLTTSQRLRPPSDPPRGVKLGETEDVKCAFGLRSTNSNTNMINILFNIMRMKNSRVRLPTKRWRPTVKSRKYWIAPCIAWCRLVLGYVSRSAVIQTTVFTVICIQIGRRSGLKGLTLYLKTSQILLMQALPGTKFRASSRAVGKTAVAVCHDGIPRWIPRFARDLIRAGRNDILRLWLTLLGTYRVIEYVGKPSFKDIVSRKAPIPRVAVKRFWYFLTHHWLPLLEKVAKWVPEGERGGFGKAVHFSLAPKRYDPRLSASADSVKLEITNTEGEKTNKYYTSFATRASSADAWLQGKFGTDLWVYAKHVLDRTQMWILREDLQEIVDKAKLMKERAPKEVSNFHGSASNFSGRLVGLPEPAGKVRIIALVDYWTQHMLKPLHDEIFAILGKIPTDGTFDQLRPVERLLKKVGPDVVIYSYDLKAATDCLSIKAQQMILSVMFSVRLAVAWKKLIVGRAYWFFGLCHDVPKGIYPHDAAGNRLNTSRGTGHFPIRYAQGQPMGAYSSWAMLALTHHAMVQWAAFMEGKVGWFDLYAVLGDDIIIADDRVAQRYRKICEWFGVEIGLAKSLISSGNTCEFAKKLFVKGEDVSGLPLKFWSAAQTSMSVASMLLAWYPGGTIANFVRALGVGFKGATGLDRTWENTPKRVRVLMVYLTHPLHSNKWSFADLAAWLWAHGPNRSWSSTDDGMVNAKPWIEIYTEGVITKLRELIKSRKRLVVAKWPIRDPTVMELHARAYQETVLFEHEVEEFADTLEDAWWKWKRRSLNRIAEYAERILALLSKAGGLPPLVQECTFRRIVDTPAFNMSKLYKDWAKARKLVLARGEVTPKVATHVAALGEGDDVGDDW